MPQIIWIIVIIVALVIEALTMGLTSIWFAAAGIITLLLSYIIPSMPVQIAIFVILSGGMIYFFYPILKRKVKQGVTKTNVDAVIGKTGIVTEAIDNLEAKGQVKISGQIWTARSMDEEILIEIGKEIVVEEVRGVKVIVSIKKEEEA